MALQARSTATINRTHRERAQPDSRRRLGELEKKKDYRKRADDFHVKEAALRTLYRKAADKNPDEFYFHMINSETKDGVHFEKRKKKDAQGEIEQKRLLETRDLMYVQHKIQIEKKKIDKLKASLHLTDLTSATSSTSLPTNKHTIFVDGPRDVREFDAAKYLKCSPALLGRKSNRLREEQMHSTSVLGVRAAEDVINTDRERRKMYKQLALRIDRLKELQIVCDKMTVHKHLSKQEKGNEPIKVNAGSTTSAPVYKWNYVRKR